MATKGSYDATRRRERAKEERQAMRLRVVEAARRLFLARGYVATTMADIAQEAGVALQSVYNAGHSKADLMHHVADLAVAGDDREVMLIDRPGYRAVAGAHSAEAQVRMIAGLIATTMERLAPVWVAYREAAAVDAQAAAELVAGHRRRHLTFGEMLRIIPEHRLRQPYEVSTDTAWGIGSIDVFLLLRSIREWDAAQYAEWLARTLVDALLAPEG